jgi:hypothetical protein
MFCTNDTWISAQLHDRKNGGGGGGVHVYVPIHLRIGETLNCGEL